MSIPLYNAQMEEIIQNLGSSRPRLLLHSCCAPCSSAVLERLIPHFEVTVFFYNPNILPEEEYRLRLKEQQRLLLALGGIPLIEGKYDPEEFLTRVRGMEALPEGGARCEVCFDLRLEETARLCKEQGFDYFTTTLTVSPHKNAHLVNESARRAAEKFGVTALPSDFKKRGGYQRSLVLSKEHGLYRQNFCGCPFSRF